MKFCEDGQSEREVRLKCEEEGNEEESDDGQSEEDWMKKSVDKSVLMKIQQSIER